MGSESSLLLPNNYEIFVKPNQLDISTRKLENYKKLAEIKQWGIKNPTKFMKDFLGVELLDAQEYTFMNSWTRPYVMWLESRSAGKALSLDTEILTPTGYKTMGELNVGDYVYSIDGTPTRIIYTSPIFENHKCYEVKFSDGEIIKCDEEHIWNIHTKSLRNRKKDVVGRKYPKIDKYYCIPIKTKDMVNDYYRESIKKNKPCKEYKYRVPLPKPIEYPTQDLEIDPYVLGIWLGDGYSEGVRITCAESDLQQTISNIEKCGYQTKIYRFPTSSTPTIGINIGHKGQKNNFYEALKKLNLVNNKHIPQKYLHGSVEQRLALLQGLMDTDGTCGNHGNCEFAQKSYDFCLQFCQLLNSLSIQYNMHERETSCNGKWFKSYRINFSTDKTFPCFRMQRKFDRLKENLANKSRYKSIVSIKEIPTIKTKCIQVEHPSKLYLCGKKNTVTHNTTMLALFAMMRGLLFNNYRIYICSGTADQSQETFKKIEDIALKNIESMTGLTDVFKGEVEVSQANSNGFIHNPMGFTYHLYNGSFVKTLNSNINAKRGRF